MSLRRSKWLRTHAARRKQSPHKPKYVATARCEPNVLMYNSVNSAYMSSAWGSHITNKKPSGWRTGVVIAHMRQSGISMMQRRCMMSTCSSRATCPPEAKASKANMPKRFTTWYAVMSSQLSTSTTRSCTLGASRYLTPTAATVMETSAAISFIIIAGNRSACKCLTSSQTRKRVKGPSNSMKKMARPSTRYSKRLLPQLYLPLESGRPRPYCTTCNRALSHILPVKGFTLHTSRTSSPCFVTSSKKACVVLFKYSSCTWFPSHRKATSMRLSPNPSANRSKLST
mmetsp:Transcript_1618/g.5594  ORF Transcript_1618/g.5594 Transcript_1618/m.5594 type:complete len:285 (+) Transcript_1618:251-1105(+)